MSILFRCQILNYPAQHGHSPDPKKPAVFGPGDALRYPDVSTCSYDGNDLSSFKML
jgi:hypothetical protein